MRRQGVGCSVGTSRICITAGVRRFRGRKFCASLMQNAGFAAPSGSPKRGWTTHLNPSFPRKLPQANPPAGAKRANEGIWKPPVISAARKPTNRRKEKSRLLSMDSSLAEHPRRGSLRRRRESSSALREYSPVRGLSIYLLLLTVVVGTVWEA
jgi:hypothetical protein